MLPNHGKSDNAPSINCNDIMLTDEETTKGYEDDSVSDMHYQHHAKEATTTAEIEQQGGEQQPYSIHSRSKKLLITIMVSCAGIISPFSGTIYYPALKPISEVNPKKKNRLIHALKSHTLMPFIVPNLKELRSIYFPHQFINYGIYGVSRCFAIILGSMLGSLWPSTSLSLHNDNLYRCLYCSS